MDSEMSMIVYSCIKNSDMWEYFCHSMDFYWADRAYPIVLVTDRYEESEKWHFDKVICLDSNWADMISTAIRESCSPYVALLMDDYFFTEHIQNEDIRVCLSVLKKTDALCIKLSGGEAVVRLSDTELRDVKEYPQKSAYCLSLHGCVWNSALFLDLVKDKSWSAWDFERIGSMDYYNPEHPVLVKVDYKLPYIEGVRKGKWMPEGIKWCIEHDVEIDYHRRPAFTRWEMFVIELQGRLLRICPNIIVKIQNSLKK